MSYSCAFCPDRVFASQKGLKSHQKQKKCAKKNRRSLSPTNPFRKFFRKKESNFPNIDEPLGKPKIKFEREDLEITNAVVPEDADRNSPEYRSKIRALRLVEREISTAYVC